MAAYDHTTAGPGGDPHRTPGTPQPKNRPILMPIKGPREIVPSLRTVLTAGAALTCLSLAPQPPP